MWMDEAACLKICLIFGHLLIPNSGDKQSGNWLYSTKPIIDTCNTTEWVPFFPICNESGTTSAQDESSGPI